MFPAWRPTGNPADALAFPVWRLPGHFVFNRRIETGECAVLFRREVRPVVKQPEHFDCSITYGSHRPVLVSARRRELIGTDRQSSGFLRELWRAHHRRNTVLDEVPVDCGSARRLHETPLGDLQSSHSQAEFRRDSAEFGVTGPPSVSVDTSRLFWMSSLSLSNQAGSRPPRQPRSRVEHINNLRGLCPLRDLSQPLLRQFTFHGRYSTSSCTHQQS